MSYTTKIILFIADICFLNLAFYGAFASPPNSGEYISLIYLIVYSNLAWMFLVLVANPYEVTKNWTVSRVTKSQLIFIFIHLLVIASLVIFFEKSYSAWKILVVYLIFTLFFLAARLIVFYIRRILTREVIRNCLIIGDNDLAKEVRRHFLMNPADGYRFVESIDFDSHFMERVQTITASREIHQIICCVPNVKKEELKELIDFGLNSLISVKIIVDPPSSGSVLLGEDERTPGLEIPVLALDEPRNQLIKRVFDLVGSILVLVLVLWWLIPILAILIKLDSKGPVFYLQPRNGRNNKPFQCIKLRSMVVVEGSSDFVQATRQDSRITRIGKFLRKSSLDEFPQFFNVLVGDMSLIGPRPHPIKLNEQFLPLISNLMSRHYVKPGITGLAQCMGFRGETRELGDMENRIRLDRYYIENWSIWLDFKIVILTVVSLIRGSEKAY
ncbi:MAG: exopolysaccharide biosynthesis polyprenyl glycosylphosphotransferase [Cyclobacteriaceae bacterium]|nr:exopolysaccharide biosynthesis polyprenyl glycosylphosphotransferase [Cyclobacteriaceae bacterium]